MSKLAAKMRTIADSGETQAKKAFHKESEKFHDKMAREHYNAQLNEPKGSLKAKHHEAMLEHHKMAAYQHREAWMNL